MFTVSDIDFNGAYFSNGNILFEAHHGSETAKFGISTHKLLGRAMSDQERGMSAGELLARHIAQHIKAMNARSRGRITHYLG